MFNRRIDCIGTLSLLLCGCVEGEQIYTLNPDGSGKVAFELKMPFFPSMNVNLAPGDPNAPKEPQTIEEMKRATLEKMLDDAKGIVAWKDLSGDFTRDGRFHIKGTAYFKELEGLKVEPVISPSAKLQPQPDGSLKLVLMDTSLKPDLPLPGDPAKKESPPDPKKATDKELDEYVLKQKIAYQSMKWFFRAMFTDLKLRNVYRLPGDVSGVKEYRLEGKREVSMELNGSEFLKTIDQFMAGDPQVFRKLLRAAKKIDPFENLEMLGIKVTASSATVAKPAPQFDFAKEVKEAQGAYPAMRKKLGLGEEKKFPGGFDPPGIKKSPRN